MRESDPKSKHATTEVASIDQNIKRKKTALSHKPSRWAWLALLPLPVASMLPIQAEEIQLALIGYEGHCCGVIPEEVDQDIADAKAARAARPFSNLIIGTGLVLAAAITIIMISILYKYAIPCIKKPYLKTIVRICLGLFLAPWILLLIWSSCYLVVRNDDFYTRRVQAPRGVLYEHATEDVLYYLVEVTHPE